MAKLLLPNEAAGEYMYGTVIKRLKNKMGQAVGTSHSDSHLDSRMNIVKTSDGAERELQHNIIATNLFTQADSEER